MLFISVKNKNLYGVDEKKKILINKNSSDILRLYC